MTIFVHLIKGDAPFFFYMKACLHDLTFSSNEQNYKYWIAIYVLTIIYVTGKLQNAKCTWILFVGLILCQDEYYIRVVVTLMETFIPLSLTKMVNASTLMSVPLISKKVQEYVSGNKHFMNIFEGIIK